MTSISRLTSDPSPPSADPGVPPAISVTVHRKDFRSNNGRRTRVLEDLSFDVHEHEFVVLLGPSGAGKTTLLRLIAGLDTDFDGKISLRGVQANPPSRDLGWVFRQPLLRHGLGRSRSMVFQELRLLPWYNVHQNISFALPRYMRRQDKKLRVDRVLRLVGLSEFASAWLHQLSGGMAKRVALARALVNLPQYLVLDEPLDGLDNFARYTLQETLLELHCTSRLTTILVTHDLDEAVFLGDRLLVLSNPPTRISGVLPVPLGRPRDRATPEFAEVRSRLLELTLGVQKSGSPQIGVGGLGAAQPRRAAAGR